MTEPRCFTGSSCLLLHDGQLVLEVRKRHKWEHDEQGHLIIGVGGIGGTLEEGESPLVGLQREAVEEIGAPVEIVDARHTVVEDTEGDRAEEPGARVDGRPPAMIWTITDPPYAVGCHVAVYLARTTAEPRPGDLPAILRVPIDWTHNASLAGVSVRQAIDEGVQVCAQEALPDDALLRPAGTWRRALEIRDTFPALFARWLEDLA